jgi:hypothetical protein
VLRGAVPVPPGVLSALACAVEAPRRGLAHSAYMVCMWSSFFKAVGFLHVHVPLCNC